MSFGKLLTICLGKVKHNKEYKKTLITKSKHIREKILKSGKYQIGKVLTEH